MKWLGLTQGRVFNRPFLRIIIQTAMHLLRLNNAFCWTLLLYDRDSLQNIVAAVQGQAELKNETELDIFTNLTNSLGHLNPSIYCVRKLLKIVNKSCKLETRFGFPQIIWKNTLDGSSYHSFCLTLYIKSVTERDIPWCRGKLGYINIHFGAIVFMQYSS